MPLEILSEYKIKAKRTTSNYQRHTSHSMIVYMQTINHDPGHGIAGYLGVSDGECKTQKYIIRTVKKNQLIRFFCPIPAFFSTESHSYSRDHILYCTLGDGRDRCNSQMVIQVSRYDRTPRQVPTARRRHYRLANHIHLFRVNILRDLTFFL